MNRPKYRIWDTYNNKYWEPTYEAYKGKLEDLTLSTSGELIMRTLPKAAIHESIFIDRFIVEFGSGLIDKKGVEVFEGDCLADYYPIDEEELSKGYHCSLLPVSYEKEKCQFVVDVSFAKDGTCLENIVSYFESHLEIKGNVHEGIFVI